MKPSDSRHWIIFHFLLYFVVVLVCRSSSAVDDWEYNLYICHARNKSYRNSETKQFKWERIEYYTKKWRNLLLKNNNNKKTEEKRQKFIQCNISGCKRTIFKWEFYFDFDHLAETLFSQSNNEYKNYILSSQRLFLLKSREYNARRLQIVSQNGREIRL